MSYAQNAWNRGELGNTVDLLDRQRPFAGQVDLRGFEWRYLWQLTHRQKMSFQKGNYDIERLLSRVVATTVAADGSDRRIPAHFTPIVARTRPECCPTCGRDALIQDPDVLDTWFSSGLWPFSTLG